MKKKIVFYFPWREVSGGPTYLCNLAKMLSEQSLYEVYYIDYKDGLSDKLLEGSKVKKIFVSEENFKIGFEEEPITIITPLYFANWLPKLHHESNILFVNWHICCNDVLRNNLPIASKDVKILLKTISENNAQFFLDRSHLLGAEFKGIKFHEQIVPAYLDKVDFPNCKDKELNSLKDVAILGRLVIDKVHSAINVLSKLNAEGNIGLRVHIIGDGPEKHRIDPSKYKNLEILFKGTISALELPSYIKKNIDLLFAMGTAVLEGARVKVPSVVIPNDTKEITCDKFVFLHETKGFCLGWHENQMRKLHIKPSTMREIIEKARLPRELQQLAQLDYQYFIDNHSYENTSNAIIEAVSRTTLKAGMFENLLSSFKKFHRLVVRKNVDFFSMERVAENIYYVRPFNSILRFRFRKRVSEKHWTLIVFGLPVVKIVRNNARIVMKPFLPNFKAAIQNLLGMQNLNLISENVNTISRNMNLISENVNTISRNMNLISENVNTISRNMNAISETKCMEMINYEEIERNKKYQTMFLDDDFYSEADRVRFCNIDKNTVLKGLANLDSLSKETVVLALNRCKKYFEVDQRSFLFTDRETSELNSIYEFYASNSLQLSEGGFLLKEHVFNSDLLTTSVFYYEHFIKEIGDISRISSKDIIDVGASFGDSAMVLSKYTTGTIHSIEPSMDNFSLLCQVIQENGLNNVTPHHLGISSSRGGSVVNYNGDYTTIEMRDTKATNEFSEKRETVPVTTIDEFVSEYGIIPGLIKVDVEGGELLVLRSSLNTLKEFRPILLLSAYHCYDDLFGLKEFLENLNLGYKFKYRKPSDHSILNDLTLIAY